MKRRNIIISSLLDEYGVSELVGTIILVLIAVIVFVLIYNYVFPLPLPSPEPNVRLLGYVDEQGRVAVEHMGGDSLQSYEIYADGTLIYKKTDDTWDIGEILYPPIGKVLLTEEDDVRLTIFEIYDDGSKQMVFNGVLHGHGSPISYPPPLLISTLRTNTSDEDLICYGNLADIDIDALTYIYNWMLNNESITDLLLPFDTEDSATTKDYSGSENNGTIIGASWTSNGKIGGAYYFDGSNDYIAFDLPNVFDDISNNDFTISMWLKSDDISDNWRRVMEARKDNMNFVQFFQLNSEIHFGVCEDGVRRSVKTGMLESNTWYNIVGVWDASEKSLAIYVNGNKSIEAGNRHYGRGSQEALHLGHRTDSSRYWLGFIDEFHLYDHILSDEQIYQYYLCTKEGYSNNSVIVSEETNIGETWKCIITPNNGTTDGAAVESNTLEIVDYTGGG
ncbi:MAG: hypothetical protein DRN08_04185 [Thermoplasmata archaeon]|nr:MAG: hypothetical protein DRN05_02805 [Thermoplasmata archaeon]RLF34737.1 MAG: hypothetical protein DRN08_04185 [Thermoplasmata archaeon]